MCNRRGPPRQRGSWRARRALDWWFGGEGLSQGCISNLFRPMQSRVFFSWPSSCWRGRECGGWVRKLSEFGLETMQSTGLTPHVVVVVQLRESASHIRLGPATQRPTRSSTGQSRRRWRCAPRRRHARGGLEEAWLEGEKKEKHGVEGYCGEPLVLGPCRVPISAPVTLGAGARGLPNRLGFGLGQRSLRGAPGMPSIRAAGDAGTSADETRGALGGGGCGRTPCEEPQPPSSSPPGQD